MRAQLILLFLVTASAAGCIGGGQDASPSASPSTGEDPSLAQAGTQRTNLSFGTGATVDRTEWANGSFDVTEHSYPKGVATSVVGEYDPDRREIDLTPLIPEGQPVRLTAEIQADLGEGDVDIWIDAPNEEIWAADYDTPYGGYSRIEVLLLHTSSEPVTLNVRYDEIDDSESFDYTLRYGARTDPSTLPEGVPVAVDLSGTVQALAIDATDPGEDLAFLLWDPQDAFLGRFEPDDDRFTLPVNLTEPGEHVVLLAEDSATARLGILGGEPASTQMRPLTQTFQTGPGVEVPPGESQASWSFDVERVPVQAGIFWSASEASQGTQARLSSPQADLLELDIDGGPWVGAGFGVTTDMGAKGLVAGTYEAQVSFDQNAGPSGMMANHVLVHYERGG